MARLQNSNSRKQGIYRGLDQTWAQAYPRFQEQDEVFFLDLENEGVANTNLARTAEYAWKESVPFPVRWDRGKPRQHQTFKDTSITIPLYRYETTLDVEIHDQEDDQLGEGSAKRQMNMAVNRYLYLPYKLMSEYLNGTASLLPSLDNAYDGNSLYATTDGDGSARFQTTNGNLLSGADSGTVTVGGLETDIFNAQQQFLSFKDTAGEPIFDASDVTLDKFFLVVPLAMNQVVQQVAKSESLRFTGSTDGGWQNNIIKGTFDWQMNPFLTDNDNYFIFLKHPYWKAMVKRQTKDIRSIWSSIDNSDRAREENIESLYTDVRVGPGIWANFTTIKINN